MEPIHKFNNGRGAMLCNGCRTIISTGPKTEELFCDKCKEIEDTIDNMGSDKKIKWTETLGSAYDGKKVIQAYYDIMDKEVHQNRSNLNE